MPSSNSHIKHIFFISLAVGAGFLAASLLFRAGSALFAMAKNAAAEKPAAQNLPAETAPVQPAPPAEATIDFVGDIMLGRGVQTSVDKNFKGDFTALFRNVWGLKSADIAFGNLEGPVSTGGRKMGSIYSFRFSPESLEAVADAGFDVLNIANNHIGDWGPDAFADTLDNISLNGLHYTGGGYGKADAENPAIIEKNGIKIGFLGFSDVGPAWMAAKDNAPGILLASDPDFDRIIRSASKQVDILVVSFHSGEEYKKQTDRQVKLFHEAIDDGAKIAVGAHPHIIQDTEEYNGGLIAYSLGNFIFDQKFSKETMQGMLLEATVTKDGLKSYAKKLIKLNDAFQPQSPSDFTQ
jgi:poly-gamma-glutamate synthesis protein (capsule biosynthesis protein)